MPKISVILPVYNVAQYIRECLDSILNQTFSDFEIICVDDCSTDNTPYIIEEYIKKDERIRMIRHQNNSGPGIARNTGIDDAKGEYIIFIDSDDSVDIKLFEILINTFNGKNVDCIWFNANIYDMINKEKKAIFSDSGKFNHDGLYEITPDNIYNGADYIWNKIFKMSVLKDYNLRFPKFYFGEDSQFYFEAFTKIKSIFYIHDCLYLHYTRSDSIVEKAKKGEGDISATFDIFMNIFEYCKNNGLISEYKNALCQLLVTRINNRTIEGQNEKILRLADAVLSKINFPNAFIEN